MTFVVAKITDRDTSKVSLMADTKLTDKNNDTLNRQTLANPFQKVVIVDDDVVIGFAGDTPQSALTQMVALRGQSVGRIEESLRSYTAEMHELGGVSKKFLMVVRKPSVQIIVIANGEKEDRTNIGTGWIGDREAFDTFSSVYQSQELQQLPDAPRVIMSMVNLVGMEDVESVGGYMVRVAGSRDKPFRFMVDGGFVLPDDLEAIVTPQADGSFSVQLRLAQGSDPTAHQRLIVPGTGATYSALALYIPEAGAAWLHTHEEPWRDPERLRVQSVAALVAAAKAEHNQLLDPTATEYVMKKYSRH